MKKQAYVIIALTSFLFVLFLSHSLLEILDFDWSIFLHNVEKTEKVEKELERNENGQILADYVRLRFEAVKE